MAQSRAHYPGLDTLRGIAILLVVLYHFFYFFRIGWIGVDLFFVLSGFLITKTLIDSRTEKSYFRNFFLRRILRIFPLYFLVLTLFFAFLPYLFSQRQPGSNFAYYNEHQAWFWTFSQNWLFIKAGIPPEPYLQHFWSLAVEEQFYLLWPFLIYFVKSLRHLKTVLAGVFFLACSIRLFLWFSHAGHEAFYYSTFARLDSLTAGAYLAVLHVQQKPILRWFQLLSFALFALTIVWALIFFNNVDHNAVPFATVGYSITALFFMCVCHKMIPLNSSFTGNRLLGFLAKISYGIYIYHLPVLLAGNFLLNKIAFFAGDKQSHSLAVSFLCLAATLIISAASYYLFELPVLNLKRHFIKT